MKLSIIIPAYNTEEYIGQCIESVLNIKEIENEIIIINDGSTDKTFEILKKYESKNSNIKLITQNNQGASVARNRGIKESTGDYIYFLDSDDWIETGSFEKIVKSVENSYNNNEEIDVLVGKEKGFSEFTKIETLDERIPKELVGKIISGKEFMEKSIKGKFWNVRLPIYLYKSSLLIENNIIFPIGRKSNEDEVFSINIFYHTKRLKIVDEIFGNYRARNGSIMSVLNVRHVEDIFENAKELIETYKNEQDLNTKNMIFYMIKRYYKSSMKKAIQCNKKDIFNNIYEQFKLDCVQYLFKTKFKKYENIELYIIYYTKNLIFSMEKNFKKIRNIKKRG
ncbi:MAG: glycosyltransferase [Leptotrichiaceae bacterium]|nr:glycosyltransferase [Leptotrichiaceae bacterium]